MLKSPYRFNVILVDDEPVICEGLKALIPWDKHGFSVCASASNGIDALRLASRSEPELFITDIKMPKMNGIELLKALREKNPDIEVILLTGFAEFEYAKDALKYGAFAYLMKPVDDEELAALLPKIYDKFSGASKAKSERLRRSLTSDGGTVESYLYASFERVFSLPETDTRLTAGEFLEMLCRFGEDSGADIFKELERMFLERGLDPGYILPGTHGCLALFQSANDINAFISSLPARNPANAARVLYGKSPGLQPLNNEREAAFYGLPDNSSVSRVYCAEEMTGMLAGALYDGSFEYAADLAEKICSALESRPCSADILKIHFNDILSELLKYLESGGCDNTCFIKIGRNIIDLLPFMTFSEFRRCLIQLVYCVDNAARDYKRKHSLGIIARVLPYIAEKCNENITLKTVADHFFVNPAYLGQQFKHKMGRSFKEYVIEQKMEKAKKMLVGTDSSVNEIAHELGFNNANYFTSSFSKWAGCTPTEYRLTQTSGDK